MMFDGSCGFTATHGSSSLFTQLTSPGSRDPEMSHDANGLALDAWLTDVVAYGPAEATPTGRRITRAATAAASRMPFLIFPPSDQIPRRIFSAGFRSVKCARRSRRRRPTRSCSERPWPTGRRLRRYVVREAIWGQPARAPHAPQSLEQDLVPLLRAQPPAAGACLCKLLTLR